MWCWRRLLRVPWTARRSNQSILEEISPECSLEGLMLKLKLQYFGRLMWELTHLNRPWCWERLRAGGEGDDRGWDGWMASPIRWTWVWVNSGSWWWIGRPDTVSTVSPSISHTVLNNLKNTDSGLQENISRKDVIIAHWCSRIKVFMNIIANFSGTWDSLTNKQAKIIRLLAIAASCLMRSPDA